MQYEVSLPRAIVVLGCPVGEDARPSPALARRLERARVEAQRDPAAWVLVTGGVVHGEPEAPFMRDWLVAQGIAASRILVESRARDTEENATLSVRLLVEHSVGTISLVTDRFHMGRARMLFALALKHAARPDVAIESAAVLGQQPTWVRSWLFATELWKRATSLVLYHWRRGVACRCIPGRA